METQGTRWMAIAATLATLALGIGWLVLGWPSKPAGRASDAGAPPPVATATPVAEARPDALAVASVRLRLRLVGSARERLGELRGVVACRPWSDSQRTQYYRGGLAGVDRAASRHERDVELPLPSPSEDGVVELGDLPLAESYHVGIWTPTGEHAARTALLAGSPQREIAVDLGDVDLEPPTGLAITLANVPAAQDAYRVRCLRTMTRPPLEHEMARRVVVRGLDAALWLSYDWPPEAQDTPGFPDYTQPVWLAAAEVTRVAPMFPDASARLVLFSRAGDVSEPLDVALVPGAITPLTIDVGALFPGGVRPCVAIDGRLVYARTAEPVVGASIWREGPDAHTPALVSDGDGRFHYDCAPTQSMSQFRVRVPTHEDGRPRVAREQVFKFAPPLFADAASSAGVALTWELPPLHWLVVANDEESDRRLRQQSAPGFPQYVVQEWSDKEQRWFSQRADEFLFEGSGFAAAVSRDGRWRAAVAIGPLELRVTEAAEVAGEPAEHRLAWATDQPPHRPRSVLVTTKSNGYPVDRLTVRASAAPDAIAWSTGVTDERGIVALGDVNADTMVLRLGLPPEEFEVRLDLREHQADLIEVRLDAP